MTPLLSQIIRLTKSILLHPVDQKPRPSAQFIAGKQHSSIIIGKPVISWWYSEYTYDAIEAIARLIIDSLIEFKDCDSESVKSIVFTTLQELCVDESLFQVYAVCFASKKNLFECIKIPVPIFAQKIQEEIVSNLRSSIGRFCTIYVLPRFQLDSFIIENESIRLINKKDKKAWENLVDRDYKFNNWTPLRPLSDCDRNSVFTPLADFECLIVAEEQGTQKGAKFSSILKFRKLAGVLHAVAAQHLERYIHKSTTSTLDFCVLFPHNSNSKVRIIRSDCAPVMPNLTSNIPLPQSCVSTIQDWYETTYKCDSQYKNRIEKAANFLNRALNSEDIEAYLNYFITLDALFGQRGSVEASILQGVTALNLEQSFVEKTKWLFELRNEIVHGGSRYISEWSKYLRYIQHFGSKPTVDVQRLAQLAVLKTPRLYC